jgi:hypothetical protein
MTDADLPAADHSAAASVLGYLHQTRWGLLELLRSPATKPDQRLSLEMHDDVAWEVEGTPTELKQLKLHVNSVRNLTNASDDMWRTLRVWMDDGRPGDPYGPILTLVTNSTAGEGSAAALLRHDGRDPVAALAILENTATNSTADETAKSRQRFLALSPAERATFVNRIHVADQSPDLAGVDEEVASRLRPGAPTEQFNTYMDLVWAWWTRTSLALLKGGRPPVSVAEMRTALETIRDQFTLDNLPSLVEVDEVDIATALLQHDSRTFVHQLRLLEMKPRQLQKAILDYQRAYLQETRWLDVHLVDYDELDRFAAKLVDEWEREFDHMCNGLAADASDEEKRAAGRDLLHALSNSTLAIRKKFQEPSHARGRRHALADIPKIGWHPEFEDHLAGMLLNKA